MEGISVLIIFVKFPVLLCVHGYFNFYLEHMYANEQHVGYWPIFATLHVCICFISVCTFFVPCPILFFF